MRPQRRGSGDADGAAGPAVGRNGAEQGRRLREGERLADGVAGPAVGQGRRGTAAQRNQRRRTLMQHGDQRMTKTKVRGDRR